MLEIAQNLKRIYSSVVRFVGRKRQKITKKQHDRLKKMNFGKARMKFELKLKEKTSRAQSFLKNQSKSIFIS